MLDIIMDSWLLWAILLWTFCMLIVLIGVRGDKEMNKPVSGEPVQRVAGGMCLLTDLPLLALVMGGAVISFILLAISGGVWLWRNVFSAMVQFGG